jgi:signal transduction histidine kinase
MAKWRSSAAYRIAFASSGGFALGLAILGVIVFAAMHLAFTRQLDSMIAEDARTLIGEYHLGGDGELGEAIAEREASHSPTRTRYAVFAPDGRRIYGSLRANRPALGLHDIAFIDPDEGLDSARGLAIDIAPGKRLVVAADREWIERIDHTVVYVFVCAFLIALLLGLAGAVVLGNYLRRRLRSISTTAETIIAGDIRKRMSVGPRLDEFDQLAATLNRMLDRIEGLLENLRQVSSDVAHDLRTPLAHLRTRLEQGKLSLATSEASTPVIDDAILRVDQVLELFSAILRIAEVESGQTRRLFGSVDLSLLVADLAESYAPAIEDGGRTLFWSVEPGIHVQGDRELLAQAVINLLENAQWHTPPSTMIRLTLVIAGTRVFVQVVDNGPGVPKADLGRVTKRFARLDSSRNTAGYGLGLSLVTAVAALHGGKLVLKGMEPGLSAVIQLPDGAGKAQLPDPGG